MAKKKKKEKQPLEEAMTGRALLLLWDALHVVKPLHASARFNYTMARNRQVLQPVVRAFAEARGNIPEECAAVKKLRDAVVLQHAVKTPTGAPLTQGGMTQIADMGAYESAMKKLRKAHKDTLVALEQYEADAAALLAEPVADLPELLTVPVNDVPDGMSGAVFDALLRVIRAV